MANINSYPKATAKTSDLLLGTSTPAAGTDDKPMTRNFSISSVLGLANPGTDLKQIVVTITPSQLLSLNGGNTLELIPAPGVNRMYVILNALINLDFKSVAYNFATAGLSDGVGLALGTTSLLNDNGFFTTNLNSLVDTYFVGDPIGPSSATQLPTNAPLNLSSTSGTSVSQGDSPVYMSILYRDININF